MRKREILERYKSSTPIREGDYVMVVDGSFMVSLSKSEEIVGLSEHLYVLISDNITMAKESWKVLLSPHGLYCYDTPTYLIKSMVNRNIYLCHTINLQKVEIGDWEVLGDDNISKQQRIDITLSNLLTE